MNPAMVEEINRRVKQLVNELYHKTTYTKQLENGFVKQKTRLEFQFSTHLLKSTNRHQSGDQYQDVTAQQRNYNHLLTEFFSL